ncbi:MAG: transglutaminase domain-containing protein [Salinibacterium sp.]|nr:transglutaminase domain-containing protein [Salinibacterium sp.]
MPERSHDRHRGLDWLTSGLMLAAVGTATAALSSILTDVLWWFSLMLVATVVLAAGAVVRFVTKHGAWGSLAAAIAAICTMTAIFAPGSAWFGIIPTFDTVDALHELEVAGVASIANQSLPASADVGIVYLLCLGVAALCVCLDLLALTWRVPALAGVPLLVLLLVPSLVNPTLDDGLFFVLTASAYVGLLLIRSRPSTRRTGVAIAAVGMVLALIVPLVLPSVTRVPPDSGTTGTATGFNPIITLGDNLRQGDPVLALTYTTTVPGGVYLRLTALDDFRGGSWTPSSVDMIPDNTVDAIGDPPGLVERVPVSPATTDITVANIRSSWLPVPYAPTSISGLTGTWSWEPDALAILSANSNARGQQYEVQSLTIAPSVDQLVAAGTSVPPGFERYLAVPDDLPAIVASTALQVVGDATTNYEKALALQSYFRGPEFTYSEQAPVDNGYDGSGAAVLGAFLVAKSGYCVHFSSAMASMARTLGIPARVVVGYTPGVPGALPGPGTEYRVTTHDLHAWPELFFVGIGWVRFEPTPGRGSAPAFAPLAVDDPTTPDIDESVPVPTVTDAAIAPTGAATDAPVESPTPSLDPSVGPDAPSEPITWGWAIVAALAALLLAPAAVRGIRRSRRMVATSRGSASAAWDELRDTAHDLGLPAAVARTPRQLALDLAPHVDSGGAAALTRLRIALEAEAFADRAGAPNPRDVAVVSWSLRRKAGLWRTLVSLFAPRSLVDPTGRAGVSAPRAGSGGRAASKPPRGTGGTDGPGHVPDDASPRPGGD